MSIDAWQIGSLSPPTVCLCCGSKFDELDHTMRGPYDVGPYKYVCTWCWKKSYMWFPDKAPGDQPASVDPAKTVSIDGSVNLEVSNGRKIAAKVVTAPIRCLRLNPNNPRIRRKFDGSREKDIEEQLWREEGTRGLYSEIRFSGGLSEKPIIDSKLVVVEGNRRLACLRRLDEEAKNGELAEYTEDAFENVQCLMLPDTVEPKDVDLLIARVHVSGKREWSPLNQAEQVFEMASKYGMSSREIATALSRSQHVIELMLQAFRSTTDFGRKYPDREGRWIHKFSYFFELFRSTYLREWAKKKKNMELFMQLVAGDRPRLYKGAQVRSLPMILKDVNSLKLLRKAGYDKAIEYVGLKQARLDHYTRALVEASNVLQLITKNPNRHLNDPEKVRVMGEIRRRTDYILGKTKLK